MLQAKSLPFRCVLSRLGFLQVYHLHLQSAAELEVSFASPSPRRQVSDTKQQLHLFIHRKKTVLTTKKSSKLWSKIYFWN